MTIQLAALAHITSYYTLGRDNAMSKIHFQGEKPDARSRLVTPSHWL
ncbi:MAG TPA: hypothetical protein V6D03_11850 [Candidatus Caenarcaniphilales bacterium]